MVFGNEAASLAMPVFPGNKNGCSVFLDLVPSGKIPNAELSANTSAAQANASLHQLHDVFQFDQLDS